MAHALSYLKFTSNDNKVILNSSSMFSGNLDRNIMDFMNDEEELLITFEKDTAEDVHIAASEVTQLINISDTPNLSELEAFIDKEYDEYVVWRNNNSLLSKNTSSASECVTAYGTFNNTKVSTGCLKSAISTESSTNNNPGSNDAVSSGARARYRNGENCLCSFLMEEIKFLRSEIKFKNEIIKSLFTSKSILHNEHKLSPLAPKQNNIKICDAMNESVGCSPNRTKVNNPTDDILCTVNNNFVNTVNNEPFNTVNKEFIDENKSPSQPNVHEDNTNITDTDFTVNCSTKNTDPVISNTDTTSDKDVLSESYLEKVIQEFKTLIANVEDFQNKNRENYK